MAQLACLESQAAILSLPFFDADFAAHCLLSPLQVLLKLQKYPFAARHYGLYTMPDKKLQVLAMQLLGNSISALRRKQPDSFMPYASVCHITLQMLAAIEGLHQVGFFASPLSISASRAPHTCSAPLEPRL